MNLFAVCFYSLSAIILVSTALAITRVNQVHAVVYLVISFFATSLLFYLLGAPLLAVLEVIIYAGAIMVLFLFVIMTMKTDHPKSKATLWRQWIFPLLMWLVCIVISVVLILRDPDAGLRIMPYFVSPVEIGTYLFKNFWLGVEIVSLLLFVALVGALYLGKGGAPSVRCGEGEKP